MTQHYLIRELSTDKIVHCVETELTGSSLDRMEDGLFAKTDHERFYVEGPQKGKAPAEDLWETEGWK